MTAVQDGHGAESVGEHVAHVFPRKLNLQVHGLRGLAALMVFVFHIYDMSLENGFWPARFEPVVTPILTGRHGVELFFIISGFLVTGSLVRHRDVGQFLLDRAIRIYPVFLTIHMIVFVTGPLIHYKWMANIIFAGWLTAFLENALFLPGIFDLPLAQLSAWSLSYEAAFYLFSAAAYIAIRHLGRQVTTPAVLLLLLPLFYLYPKASYFLVGTLIFFFGSGIFARMPRLLSAASVPAFALTLLFLLLSEWNDMFSYLGCLPAFVFFACIVEGAGALSRFLRLPLLQYTGTVSYSFYLWSAMVTYPSKIAIGRLLSGRMPDELRLLIFAALSTGLVYLVSHYSHRYLEDGARKLIRSRIRPYRKSA
jgi:peptidoglycan/LPS O-acetylase OafA/YrhL